MSKPVILDYERCHHRPLTNTREQLTITPEEVSALRARIANWAPELPRPDGLIEKLRWHEKQERRQLFGWFIALKSYWSPCDGNRD